MTGEEGEAWRLWGSWGPLGSLGGWEGEARGGPAVGAGRLDAELAVAWIHRGLWG